MANRVHLAAPIVLPFGRIASCWVQYATRHDGLSDPPASSILQPFCNRSTWDDEAFSETDARDRSISQSLIGALPADSKFGREFVNGIVGRVSLLLCFGHGSLTPCFVLSGAVY